jgi:prepilin-type N-terminal cleavage/methylation domain-containing protein
VIKEKTMNFKSLLLSKKGFTLIELFIVIVILVIISGAVIYLSPKIIAKQRLKNDAWQILNDVKEVQERARAQLERLKIEFDLNSKTSYRYEKRRDAFNSGISENIGLRNLTNLIYLKSVRIGNTTYGTGKASFMYDEWGTPKKIDNSDSGEIIITIETATIKNSSGQNMSVDIIISPGTGRLRMDGPK